MARLQGDTYTLHCAQHGVNNDQWLVTDKATPPRSIGTLTVHHKGCVFNGWDWDGDPTLVNSDGTATDAMQEILDLLASDYE